MKVNQIQERIHNTEEKIQKKLALIEKRNKIIEKFADIPTYEELWKIEAEKRDSNWEDNCEKAYKVSDAKESIESAKKEIAKFESTLQKYKEQLAKEQVRELQIEELPEQMKKLKEFIIQKDYEFMIQYKARIKEARKKYSYKEFIRKYSNADAELLYKSDDDIKRDSEKTAENIIINTISKVHKITGDITDWKGVYVTLGSNNSLVLNGIVEGENGKARLESINAGGYNIQKLHIRVLVKKI